MEGISSEVVVAVCSLLGTMAGTFGGMQLTNYRIKQLEKMVNRHNGVIERMEVLFDLCEPALKRFIRKEQ